MFVLSSAASGTLPEDVRTYYCCRRHKSVVYKTHYFYIADSDVYLKQHTHTQNAPCISTARMVTWTHHNITLYVPCLSCHKYCRKIFYWV